MHQMPAILRVAGLCVLTGSLSACAPDAIVQPSESAAISAAASRPLFVFPGGCCYYEDEVVRTVVPPASSPHEGVDDFYAFPSGGATGQKGVVAVAPGDTDYHGGKWRFHAVTWNVTPYLLTSASAVLAAEASGDVTIVRVPENDFKCPIQP